MRVQRIAKQVVQLAKLPGVWMLASARGLSVDQHFTQAQVYCQFLGYPRSGHTLVAALLNAHPQIVIANELGVLNWMSRGFSRRQILAMILRSDSKFAQRNFQFLDFDFHVPNQWQGRFEQIRVVGDKDAARDTRRLERQPELLQRLVDRLHLKLRILHVVRNPFDMLATFVNRRNKRGEQTDLDNAIRMAVPHVETVNAIINRYPVDAHRLIRHEDLVARPREVLADTCRFLGVDAPPDYLDACAAIVFPSPRRTRTTVEWTPKQIDFVNRELVGRNAYLSGYGFDT